MDGAHLPGFHPAVSGWFRRSFPAPTGAQVEGWAAIADGRHTLIAAPTGSGKTLAAFLSAIDSLVTEGVRESGLPDETRIVYVSPLKALSNDIERNLQQPLAGIRDELHRLGLAPVEIRVAVRTGDTPASARTAMVKRPPHILVTTPESLYILLTSGGGQRMLAHTKTLIVDEIHAVVDDKRGAHLALTLERLSHLVAHPINRIGLSATQRPISRVARFLTGDAQADACAIVDIGHRRALELQISLPPSPLEAVTSGEVWEEIYNQLADHVRAHRTTLIFVNARRMTERIARHLQERLGPGAVAAHHGSLSRKQRLLSEQQLKRGELRALVATASMELGIDVGAVELVCQLGPTRSIASLVQRIGRAGHQVGATSKGILFPLSRDDLITCLALKDSIARGELDEVIWPEAPLDILAQQIVATVASRDEPSGWDEQDLYTLVTGAAPYRDLRREDFDEVVAMLADGVATRRGRRAAYLHRDRVHHRVRARRGGRLTAITSGGAIPDNADYSVVQEPSGTVVGSVHEDFAVESLAGDVFQLGNTSWKILKVEPGKVRVEDAAGQPPSLPFWIGEVPGRSEELSQAVDRLRCEIAQQLMPAPSAEKRDHTITWLQDRLDISHEAATQTVVYLAASLAALGVMPSRQDLVLERFFDGSGGMQLIVHAPFGTRVNRAWGLSLRKRFCRKFNFELQAAATDDAIVISLGEVHSFPLADVFHYLRTRGLRDLLVQALLDSPMFAVRWRWNANRSLAVPRFFAGKKVAPQLQRMQADDLASVVFPDQAACFENIAGEREVPDHPLVRQTIHDCLTEAMDIQGFTELIGAIERGEKRLHAVELTEPSPLAHEILHARPYAFLDDAPLEERRTQAVRTRRYLDPDHADELGRLDPEAIANVREQAWPVADHTEELHDALLQLGFLTAQEVAEGRTRDGGLWTELACELTQAGRAARVFGEHLDLWVAAERLTGVLALRPDAELEPQLDLPPELCEPVEPDLAAVELVRARLSGLGPVTSSQLAAQVGIDVHTIDAALLALETEGYAVRGVFEPEAGPQWCERGLLARIGRHTLRTLRRAVSPVSTAAFMRFLLHWQGLDDPSESEGPEALAGVLAQLEGFEVAASAWEQVILPKRFSRYQPQWLDTLCQSGQLSWGRLAPPTGGEGPASGPVKTTPLTLIARDTAPLWQQLARVGQPEQGRVLSSQAQRVEALLHQRGAQFFSELVRNTRLLATEVERALGELVAVGRVSSDGFAGLRALLAPKVPRSASRRRARGRRPVLSPMDRAGRWFLLVQQFDPFDEPTGQDADDPRVRERAVTHVARVLLRRYGVVFRKLLTRERNLPPWRELVRVLRRLEARGEVRGGRFVDGALCGGEQYALPEAVAPLRNQRDKDASRSYICVDASDPLNLAGIILPGSRVAAILGNRLVFRGGEIIATREAGTIEHRIALTPEQSWEVDTLLTRAFTGLRSRAAMVTPQ